MVSLQMLSLNSSNNLPSLPPQLSFTTTKRFATSWMLHAVDKDSKQYEIDPDKAKDALQKLDQQLQSLSNKQVSSPKIKASDVKLTRRIDDKVIEEDEEVPFSGSFLTILTTGLVLFTIFYNVLFYTMIKPSIDGPEFEPTTATVQESPQAPVLLLPSAL